MNSRGTVGFLAVAAALLALAAGLDTGRSIASPLLPAPAMAQDDSGDSDAPDRDEPDRNVPDKSEPAATTISGASDWGPDLWFLDLTGPVGACETRVIVTGAVIGAIAGDLIAGGLLVRTVAGFVAPSLGVTVPAGLSYRWSALAALLGAGIGANLACRPSAAD